jgi:hypothetical protein
LLLPEFGEHQSDARLNLFIGVDDDVAGPIMNKAARKRHAKLAARGFLQFPLM